MKLLKVGLVLGMFVVIMWLILSTICHAGVNVAFTGNVGYNVGTWKSGMLPSPTGTEKDTSVGYNGTLQVIYNEWKFKPTAEVSVGYNSFDFSTYQAPVQYAKPLILSFRVGLTKDLKLLEVYGLVGYSWSWTRAGIIEDLGDKWLNHGTPTVRDQGMSFKFGAYKLIDLGTFKIGPELSAEVFPVSLGFSRCRKFSTWNVHPYLGLRIQF